MQELNADQVTVAVWVDHQISLWPTVDDDAPWELLIRRVRGELEVRLARPGCPSDVPGPPHQILVPALNRVADARHKGSRVEVEPLQLGVAEMACRSSAG
jgi:hypothetical protein